MSGEIVDGDRATVESERRATGAAPSHGRTYGAIYGAICGFPGMHKAKGVP
jgi:hypothetical protein